MGEFIPTIHNGKIESFLNIGGDFLQIKRGSLELFYIFFPRKCVNISQFVTGQYLSIKDATINIMNYLAPTPTVLGYTIPDLEEFVKSFAEKFRCKLKDKKIIVDWSGGKDSTANLIFFLKLSDYIPFKLWAVYVHIPFLESERNREFVEKVASKLGVNLIILEPDRKLFRDLLLERGMPMRGRRWCTFQKVKTIRKFKKQNKIDYEVVSDRISEGYKRLKSLHTFLFGKLFISGSQLKPMFFATLLDIVKICRDFNVVHPDYLKGFTRISCALCPYRPIHEIFEVSKEIEDSSFIEDIMKLTYEKRYKNVATYEEFINYALWRYHPEQAMNLINVWKKLTKEESLETLIITEVSKMFSSIWYEKLPDAPYITIDELRKLIKDALANKIYSVIYPASFKK